MWGSNASNVGGGGKGGGTSSGDSLPLVVGPPRSSVSAVEMVGLVAWRSANNASKNSIFLFSFSSTEGFLVFPGIFKMGIFYTRSCFDEFFEWSSMLHRYFYKFIQCAVIELPRAYWMTSKTCFQMCSSPKHSKMTQRGINYSRGYCHVWFRTHHF